MVASLAARTAEKIRRPRADSFGLNLGLKWVVAQVESRSSAQGISGIDHQPDDCGQSQSDQRRRQHCFGFARTLPGLPVRK